MNLLKNFDNSVGEIGLPKTLLKTLLKINSVPKVIYDSDETQEVLSQDPVIVICNHPFELDVLPIVATLPTRPDIKVFASVNYQQVGKNTANFIIPAYIRHDEVKSSKLTTWLGSNLSRKKIEPKATSLQKNIESIDKAAEAINQGSLLFFSPEGPMGIQGGWKNGLGHLLLKIKNRKDTFLVMAHVQGVTALDHARIIPGIRKLFPKITVRYSEAVPLNKIITNNDYKFLVQELREKYYSWIKINSSSK